MDLRQVISDRLQKLTNALYRVTDLLSDREPLKWILRNKALKIYDIFSLLLSDIDIKDKNKKLNEGLSYLSQIINILGMMSNGDSLFYKNFEILNKEYNNLKLFVQGERETIISDIKFLPEFSALNKSSNKKDFKANKTINNKISIGQENNYSIGQNNKAVERRNKILEILKTQGPKTISEITPSFLGISEKTIQRDLIFLVKTNKIKAEGEKRWRKYYYFEES